MKMTPEEKWKRMTNPQIIEDYGLTLTKTELETFAEGRIVVATMENKKTRRAAADRPSTEKPRCHECLKKQK